MTQNHLRIGQALIILLLLFSLQIDLVAQVDEIQYNSHRYEIGLDFQNIFNLNEGVGSNLILKKRIGEKKYISKNEKRVFRLTIGGVGQIPVNKKYENSEIDSLDHYEIRRLVENGFSFNLSVGHEWQLQKKRIQYFYGLDLGYEYGNNNSISYSRREGIGSNFIDEFTLTHYAVENRKTNSIPLTLFGGIKYFLSPEFSVSIESSLNLKYSSIIIKDILYDVLMNTERETIIPDVKNFQYSFSFVRFINFSYYLK